eukprot:TRINITY_DN5078_c0_g1_i1.p1 TRINITY_DN5078_c0_g1~~TRINITY_DN5078_c0_g1_i1.p1  ORF type:complete len:172 (-),score=22.15 TRINITY_DN5078_c0_g1_i1:903-1418(-)
MEGPTGRTQGHEWLQIVAVLDRATAAMQSLFLTCWELVDGTAWDDSSAKDQHSKALAGNVREWDISLLAQLLLHMNWATTGVQDPDAQKRMQEENNAVKQVKQVHIVHCILALHNCRSMMHASFGGNSSTHWLSWEKMKTSLSYSRLKPSWRSHRRASQLLLLRCCAKLMN